MVRIRRKLVAAIARLACLCILLETLGACGVARGPASDSSSLTIQFPSAEQAKSMKVSTSWAYDWDRVCYVANVTATDLPKSTASSCDVTLGIYVGSVAPGTAVELSIPRGKDRKLEIFAYLRESASETCKPLVGGFGDLDRTKIARVSEPTVFDTQTDHLELPVSVSAPAAGTSVLSQYSLPATCTKPVPTAGSGRFSAGHVVQTGGGLVIDANVSGRKSEVTLSGGAFKIQLSRKSD